MLIPNDYPSMLKLHEQYLADHAMWAQETFGGKRWYGTQYSYC